MRLEGDETIIPPGIIPVNDKKALIFKNSQSFVL
jgi:hypothetical protein